MTAAGTVATRRLRRPPAPEETVRERLAYGTFASIEWLAMTLPTFVGRRLFDLAGIAAFHFAETSRRIVAANLSRVLGRDPRSPLVQGATRDAFRSYARYWWDAFHIRVMPDEEFLRRYRMVGWEHVERALAAGRGAVMALPHLGNWDAAGRWVHLSGYRISAVAERLRPERLAQLFHGHRTALGLGIVTLDDERAVAQDLVRLIGESELVALVSDRDLRGSGVVVEMFGEERRMPAGPALLSLFTGSPLLPAACYDLEDGWITYIEEPLEVERTGSMRQDVATLTRLLAKRFERSISAAPTQWHLFQPAWEPVVPRRAAERSPVAEAPTGGAAAPSTG